MVMGDAPSRGSVHRNGSLKAGGKIGMALLVFIGTYLLFSLSRLFFRIDYKWYNGLRKSYATPPSGFIQLIWFIICGLLSFAVTILYKTVGFSGLNWQWFLFFWLNYLFHQLYWYVLFFRKNLWLAWIDSLLVAVTSFLLIVATVPYASLAGLLLVPSLLWTSFTTFLTRELYRANR